MAEQVHCCKSQQHEPLRAMINTMPQFHDCAEEARRLISGGHRRGLSQPVEKGESRQYCSDDLAVCML